MMTITEKLNRLLEHLEGEGKNEAAVVAKEAMETITKLEVKLEAATDAFLHGVEPQHNPRDWSAW